MKETMRYGSVLALICIIAAGLLASVNSLTKPKILAQAQAEEEASLKEVLPEGASFEPIKENDELIYYKARDKQGKLVGVAFKASGKGYSSAVETMVGMRKDGTIVSIKIIAHNETPGLGERIAEPGFSSQFKNKNIKDFNDVQAITGATISSKAVIDSVKEKAEEIKVLLKEMQEYEK